MLQKVNGEETSAICREEFQAFMKYFVDPLMQKAVRDRMAKEALAGANAPTYDSPVSDKKMNFTQVVCHTKVKFQEAYNALEHEKWHPEKNVSVLAYKPRAVPYYVTIDNAPCHSFWIDVYKKHLVQPGVPLMHLIRMPPHGHDLHQLVEHANGVVKVHASKGMHRLVCESSGNHVLSADDVHELVQEGIKLFTAESHARNVRRWKECLRIVAARQGEIVEVVNSSGKVLKTPGTQGGHACKGFN